MNQQECETKYAERDQYGLHEITVKLNDGSIRKVVLDATNASEAEELLRSLPGMNDCTIVSIIAIMHGIYWV